MKHFILILLFILLLPFNLYAEKGDVKAGREVYDRECWKCHGKEGKGDGPDGANVFPKPRDFTSGIFKYRVSSYKEIFPFDRDLFQTIGDGLTGTAMPPWKGKLSDKEIWDVTAYIKTFGGIDEEAKEKISYKGRIRPSAESIAKGKELFLDRCAECHGDEGRGNTSKKLKDEWGRNIWPRDFTKGYSFRIGNAPREIYTRISTGIPGTPMPSFSDPKAKKGLSTEEMWHVANYTASLDDRERVFNEKRGKVLTAKFKETFPEEFDDPIWREAQPFTFPLSPQVAAGEKPFTSLNDTMTGRSFYNDKEIIFLLEWNDRTYSKRGDPDSEKLSDGELYDDAVALYFPAGVVREDASKPYFGMGDEKNPVNVWYLTASGLRKEFDLKGVEVFDGKNIRKSLIVDAKGEYKNGRWKVIMKRQIKTPVDIDAQFEAGKLIPLSLSVWDGTNGEKDLKHTFTGWFWIGLKPSGEGCF
jgi:DMSO reductase family type II enzyme heme b subunit